MQEQDTRMSTTDGQRLEQQQQLASKKKRIDEWLQQQQLASKKKKRMTRRHGFITSEVFNRNMFRYKRPMEWTDLARDCIYQLNDSYTIKHRVVGTLTGPRGNVLSVFLPMFVINQLLARDETNVKVYIRPKGDDKVDIATIKKTVCRDCKKEFSSRNYLVRHLKYCKGKHVLL